MATEDNFQISGENRMQDKITAIKNLAKSYNMRMRGFSWDTSNENWIITGKALATSTYINETTGIITSFAEPANLITTKTPEKYFFEFKDAFLRANGMIINDLGIPATRYRAVIKIFKDTMSNIGDIITGSKEMITTVLKSFKEETGGVYE